MIVFAKAELVLEHERATTHDPRVTSLADRTVSLEGGWVVADSYGEFIDRERLAVGA